MRRFASLGIAAWLVSCLAAGSVMAAETPKKEIYWPPIIDTPTQAWIPGKWVWAELVTRDVGTAAEFYGKVFGWTFQTYGPKDDAKTYTLVSSNGTPIAGMVFANPRDRSMRPDARWVGLMSVTDVGATVGRVTAAGGKVIVEPRQLGGRGEGALLADPEGALFGVIHSAAGDPEDFLGDENCWLWTELWADDSAAMAKFYSTVGGYTVMDGARPGERQGFHLVAGGYARAGVLPKPIAKTPTTWIPYVRVANVDDTVARAKAAGGNIVVEPMAGHGTRVALVVDPTGAPFAVAEWHQP